MERHLLCQGAADLVELGPDGVPVADDVADTAKTKAAIAVLEVGGPDAYAPALAAPRDERREWWES